MSFEPTSLGDRAHSAIALSDARQAAGFSLLEVLVAFVILALVATAMFELFGGALRTASTAGGLEPRDARRAKPPGARREHACRCARASEARHRRRRPHRMADLVAPYVIPDANPDLERLSETMPTRLYHVSVDVHYAGGDGKDRSR